MEWMSPHIIFADNWAMSSRIRGSYGESLVIYEAFLSGYVTVQKRMKSLVWKSPELRSTL